MRAPGESPESSPEKFSFPLSPLARTIFEMVKNDRATVKELAEIIAAESLFSARLLKVVNLSAGLSHKLSTVAQAVNVFGMEHLKSLALGLALFQMESRPPKEKAPPAAGAITLRQLWEHSLGCAAMAARIATKVDQASPHLAFVAGFLHDVGRVLFYRYWQERFQEAMALAAAKKLPAAEAETLGLGINHLEFGALWARQVETPVSLQQAIRHHHEPFSMLPDDIDAETRRIISIVQLADMACESHAIGYGGDARECPGELWTQLHLRAEGWTDHLQTVKSEVEGSRAVFGFDGEDYAVPTARTEAAVATKSNPEPKNLALNLARRGQIIPFPDRRDNPDRVSGAAREAGTDAKKITILVVEDHGSLCEMLSICFMRFGYHVRTANDGKTALEILAKEEVHLVLLDLMLPRVDGFAVLKQMREIPGRRVPYVIVVSAGASEKDRNKVLELGADEYMPKPFHLSRLLERVQTVEKFLL